MNKKIKAVIPIAGWGTRLRPHTYSQAKVLLMVAGKPVLGHILDRIQQAGIEEVVFVTGYLGNLVEEYVKKHYAFKTHFVEQKELRGLGHAISLTESVVGDAPLFIILGDTIIDVDFKNLFAKDEGFLGVKEVADPRRFGVVTLQGDYIIQMVEKPEKPVSNLAIVGMYYLPNSTLLYRCLQQNIKEGKTTKGEIQLTDALQRMIDQQEKLSIRKIDAWYDCGTIESLLQTNHILLEKAASLVPSRDTVVIVPPVAIAPGVDIAHAIIGPDVCIAEGARIYNSILSDAIIHREAHIDHAVISHSVVGVRASIKGKSQRFNIGDDTECNTM